MMLIQPPISVMENTGRLMELIILGFIDVTRSMGIKRTTYRKNGAKSCYIMLRHIGFQMHDELFMIGGAIGVYYLFAW